MQESVNILIVFHRSDKARLQRLLWTSFNQLSNNDKHTLNLFYKELSSAEPPKSDLAQTVVLSNDSYLHETAHIIMPIISSNFLATNLASIFHNNFVKEIHLAISCCDNFCRIKT